MGGTLPASSVFYSYEKRIVSNYILGSLKPFDRKPAYMRLLDFFELKIREIKRGKIRIKHSPITTEDSRFSFTPYESLDLPEDLIFSSSFSDILADQAILNGVLEERDKMKLIFQALYGAQHLLGDIDKARVFFMDEWNSLEIANNEPLAESISPDGELYRINLRPSKEIDISPASLFDSVVTSAEKISINIRKRIKRLLSQLKSQGINFENLDSVPPGHSSSYRQRNHPSYRIIDSEEISVLLKQIGILSDYK
jgi:hypothetical protein